MTDMSSRPIVLSDVHMYSPVSMYPQVLAELEKRLAGCPVCVLNGDIIDFRRSVLGAVTNTTKAALKWLVELLERFPNCQFYYLLGNHDSATPFIAGLAQLKNPNFHLEPYVLRLGTNIFLHGDVCNQETSAAELISRRLEYGEMQRDYISAAIARTIVALRLHYAAHIAHSKPILAERILKYLRTVENFSLEGVTDIFFGHTHSSFKDFEYKGFQFHNTGAAIRGLRAEIMEFTYSTDNTNPLR